MKKTLVYHLYVGGDIDTNLCYKVHSECLRHFIHIFDNVRFTIAVDDLSNKESIQKGVEWILNLGTKCEIEMTVEENSNFRDALTFYKKVLKNNDDELIFFFHSKGTTNFVDEDRSIDSVFNWICGIYYYNLHDDYKTHGTLITTNKTMNGPFLLTPKENIGQNEKYYQFYAGAGYWINNVSLKNLVSSERIKEVGLSNKFLAEMYPGIVLSTNEEYGLEGVNKKMFIQPQIDGTAFYNGSIGDWEYIFSLYPYPEKAKEFIRYIGNKVGFMPFNY